MPRDLALGSDEAAALMGVHFTRPARMYNAGCLVGRECESITGDCVRRVFIIYSSQACEDNFREYEARTGGRRRNGVHRRPDALRRLDEAKPQIEYADAIGVADAAKLLKVHYTAVYKLIEAGKIAARKPWNHRHKGPRSLIVSRRSCEANRREVALLENTGKKRGRRRYGSKRGLKPPGV